MLTFIMKDPSRANFECATALLKEWGVDYYDHYNIVTAKYEVDITDRNKKDVPTKVWKWLVAHSETTPFGSA
jgi:hypothetical protein